MTDEPKPASEKPSHTSAHGLTFEEETRERLKLLEENVMGIAVRITQYLAYRDREKRPVSLEGIRALLADLAEGIQEYNKET
jgi:hypothetical protein